MSYNPSRQSAASNPRRQRRLDPRAGIHHSDIIAKHGPAAATITDLRHREETSRGWRAVLFCGDEFEMIYEYICAKNASGMICNPEKDRALRLMAGELFITTGGEVAHLHSGASLALPKGIEYQIATSGTADAELIFCQGSDYENSLEQISDPEAVNAETKMNLVEPSDTPAREKVSAESTRKYAEKMQEQRHQRDVDRRRGLSRVVDEQSAAATSGAEAVVTATPRRTPPRRVLPGQQVQGVNPRPMGAAGFGDDD